MKGVTLNDESCTEIGDISTHTPVKGVTENDESNFDFDCISTHTPVKGVTCESQKEWNIARFQLTRP